MAPSSPEPLQQAGRITTVILLLASLLFLSNPSAGAAPVAVAATTVPVMVVLDASGSMKTADAPGPRIDAAKAAVSQLVDRLPANTQVGLQVYGTGTGSSDADKSAGCNDITTLMPVATLDTPAMKTAVSKVTASGYTPIGKALEAAAAALPAEGPRSIVLVSDGEDTCAPPAPCDVAKKLKQQGIDLVIHTVGFKVDAAARQQLSCIATATNGTYSDADDAGQLTQALQTKVDYAITGYTPTGTAVTGDNDPSEQAPLLAPGQYVDHYALGWAKDDGSGRPSTKKYYTIPVTPGVRPYISVTVVPPAEGVASSLESLGAKIRLLNKARQECGSPQSDLTLINRDRPFGSSTVLAGPVIGGPTYYDDRCPTTGVMIVEITRAGTAYANTSLPLEIVVRMEPPADISAVPPAADAGPVLASPNPDQQKAVAIKGGSSFNDAAQVLSGATYSDTVVTGESRYYQVPLRWGQRLSYTVTEVGPARPALGLYGALVGVDVFGPVRNEIATSSTGSNAYWFSTRAAEPFTASTTYPVRYQNRTVSLRNSSLDGVHYLRLTAGFNTERKSSSTRFLITVVVSGAVEKGPVYLPPGTVAPTGTSEVPTTSPTTPTAATTSAAATLPSTSSSTQVSGSSTPPTTATSGSVGSSAAGSTTTPATADAGQTVALKQLSGSADITSNGWPVWIYAALGFLLVGIVGIGIGVAWSRRGGSATGR